MTTLFKVNSLPPLALAALPFRKFTSADQSRTISAGATDGAMVDTFVFNSPIAVYGPLMLFLGSTVNVGSLTMTVEVYLNDVLVETRTGVSLGLAGARSFLRLGPSSLGDISTAANQNAISVLQPQYFSFGTKKLKVKTRVTANTAPDSRVMWVEFNGYEIDSTLEIDEFVSFVDESATVSGKGSADIGVPFTVIQKTGRGRLFTPVQISDLVTAGGSGNRQFTLRVDDLDIVTLGPNALSTATHYHALGLVSPNFVQNGTQTLEGFPGIAQPPSILVSNYVQVLCTITSHSSPHTSSYTGKFFWGKFG